MSLLKVLPYTAYTVALICPLEVEMSAARFMLDEEHEILPPAPQDTNQYILGQLSGHNVVIASLPEGSQGTSSAAAVAVHVSRTFPYITMRLLVGIGGGIPSDKVDIRLGDVAISIPSGGLGGVVEYTLGRQTPNGFVRKGFLCPPATEWRTIIPRMKSDHRLRPNRVSEYLSAMLQKSDRLNVFQKPSEGKDILFQPSYEHVPDQQSCITCDHSKAIKRPSRRFPNEPVLHYGLIASGNWVMKDGIQRQLISDDLGGAICFEMEAAGLMNDFSCLVIRGISDYADSHKNDDWHPYAAATAAGVAKEILSYVNATEGLLSPTATFSRTLSGFHSGRASPSQDIAVENKHFIIPRKVNSAFTGRANLLKEIKDALIPRTLDMSLNEFEEPLIYVITGMGGIGKSEVCLKLANMMRNSFWAIFWVDVSNMLNATRGFSTICQRLQLPESNILSALCALTNLRQPWLLILDNADDPDQDLTAFIPAGSCGSILITSRIPDTNVHATVGNASLEGLPESEALDLFSRSSSLKRNMLTEDKDRQFRELVIQLLMCHTLAIIQAGAYIRQGYATLDSYVELFRQSNRDKEVEMRQTRALQFRPTQERPRYQCVYNTFEISLSFLEDAKSPENADALCLLNLLAMLSHTEFPTIFFQIAWETSKVNEQLSRPLETSDTPVWEHTCQWHRQHLPEFLALSTHSWDCFRLQAAINKFVNLALLNRSVLDEQEVISMHPLIHAWARVRQQGRAGNASWLQAGSLIAHTWRDDSTHRSEGQVVSHIQALLSMEIEYIFNIGPSPEIAIILLKCALHLCRQGFFLHMSLIVRDVFKHFKESPDDPTLPLVHFHLVDAELNAVVWKKHHHKSTLNKIVHLLDSRPPHDRLLLRAKVKYARALYDVLDKNAIATMKTVIDTAWQHRQIWDKELLMWQLNLAGLYADDGKIHEATRILEIVIHVKDRLPALSTVQCDKIDDIQFAKQILRALIIRRKWLKSSTITLPLEDRLPEERYRNQIWSGRHILELDLKPNSGTAVPRIIIGKSAIAMQMSTASCSPKFHLFLRIGAYKQAIEYLKHIEQRVQIHNTETLWVSNERSRELQLTQHVSGLVQSASEVAADHAFLEHFQFPPLGSDIEVDQLRAQEKASHFPGHEIIPLQDIDPEKAALHPYVKLSEKEKAKYIMAGRWDKFECPPELKKLIKQHQTRIQAKIQRSQLSRTSGYVDITKQLLQLDYPPPWWYK